MPRMDRLVQRKAVEERNQTVESEDKIELKVEAEGRTVLKVEAEGRTVLKVGAERCKTVEVELGDVD